MNVEYIKRDYIYIKMALIKGISRSTKSGAQGQWIIIYSKDL